MVVGGKHRVHIIYPDQTELVEEYDVTSYELLSRKWKKHKPIGKEEWLLEMGDPNPGFNPETDLMAPTSSNVC